MKGSTTSERSQTPRGSCGALVGALLAFAVGCNEPSPVSTAAKNEASTTSAPKGNAAAATSTTKPAPAKTLPNARTYVRKPATFVQGDTTWIFRPTDTGFDVVDKSGTPRFVVVQKGRGFHLQDLKGNGLKLAVTWGPLGMSIGRKELGAAFLTVRLTPKGWVLHRPGKVQIGTYHGPLLRLGDRAATARADGTGNVRAKIAGRPEVVHTGGLAAREVVLTLLPDLDLVEAATVALFFAEESW